MYSTKKKRIERNYVYKQQAAGNKIAKDGI